jgi:hypothetical protein
MSEGENNPGELAQQLSPTFATRALELPKGLIFRGWRGQGRHHSAACHDDAGTSAAITLGGGWSGKTIFKLWSRMAWSISGSV